MSRFIRCNVNQEIYNLNKYRTIFLDSSLVSSKYRVIGTYNSFGEDILMEFDNEIKAEQAFENLCDQLNIKSE